MKKAFSLILTLSLSAGLLAGCSGSGTEKRVVNVCSWGEYIDESLIQQFEEATGIEVNYQTSPSNEELYSSLTLGGTSYDVIVPSDYMISQLIEEDMLQPLDYDKIPNFSKIADRFKNLSYDPENLYTVPYTWGTLGIIYNSTMVDQPITSWDAMFDPQYADQVLMINNSRDALGIALMDLGYSVNTDSEEELRAAYDLLAEAKKAGVYQAWVMDEVFDKMEAGEAAAKASYDCSVANNDAAIQTLKDNGMTVSEIDMTDIYAAVQPVIDKYSESIPEVKTLVEAAAAATTND